jgi:hypothetical protein
MSSNPTPLDEAQHEIACLKAEVAALRRINASNAAQYGLVHTDGSRSGGQPVGMNAAGLAGELAALAAKAAQTADDIRYYSGGSKHNQPAEDLTNLVVNNLPTIIAALRQPASDPGEVERVARAIFRCDFAFDEDEAIVLEKWGEWLSTRERSLRQARAAIAALQVKP